MPTLVSTRLPRPRARAALLFAAALAVVPGAAPSADSRTGSFQLAQATTPAPAAKAQPFSTEQRSAIEAIIKDYLIANPEVMLDVQNALEAKMEKIQADRLKLAIEQNADKIYRAAESPVAGNVKGDITVVEFFDYNCGYCKKAFADIAKLVDKDPKIKLVLKELPILSRGSEEASRVALAARMQGKYWEVHRALLSSRGEMNEQAALRVAEKAGVDMAKLRVDMKSPAVTAEIAAVRELAQRMGIQGTPHFLVGDRAIAGAPQNLLEGMSRHVAELRKTGCKVC